MATETPAQMAARFRKMAQDPKLPQSVKNTYLDKANAVEKAAAKPTMAKGGMVKKAVAKKPLPMAKGGAVKSKAKPKKYADGGAVMEQPTAMPQPAAMQQSQQQPVMGRREQRMQQLGGRMQQTVQGMPAYQQLQNMSKQFSQTNQPTPAQIAQMQQYEQQIKTNPRFMKMQANMQNMQQAAMPRQPQPQVMPRQTTGTVGTVNSGITTAVMPPMNTPKTMGGSANKMGPQAGMVPQMPMAKGGMVGRGDGCCMKGKTKGAMR